MILPPEEPNGNIEYKWKLLDRGEDYFQKCITQMKYRIDEGNGEAIYYLGVMDNGICCGCSLDEFQESETMLAKMSHYLNMTLYTVRTLDMGYLLKMGQYRILPKEGSGYIDLKIGIIGNVDSGKSTLTSVLCFKEQDNGRGSARNKVFQFKHEKETGRTSSIGHQIMIFTSQGTVLSSIKNWKDQIDKASKIVTFYDLAGHEKYLRTTIYGLSSSLPDYCVVVVGANQGVSVMTKEHIGLCIALHIPFFVVVTKIDMAPPHILQENLIKLQTILKTKAHRFPIVIENVSDMDTCLQNIRFENFVPIFCVSCVSLVNFNLLRNYLFHLPTRNKFGQLIHQPIEMWIDSHFSVPGHGTVVSGLLRSGIIRSNMNLFLGPTTQGEFLPVRSKSIQIKQREMQEARPGYYICIALKNTPRKWIRKGMVLIGDNAPQKIYKKFICSIRVLQSHHTTIRIGYQPFLHIGQVRQTATIIDIQKKNKATEHDNTLRTGDVAEMTMEFLHHREYIKEGIPLLFREGRVRAIGNITRVIEE